MVIAIYTPEDVADMREVAKNLRVSAADYKARGLHYAGTLEMADTIEQRATDAENEWMRLGKALLNALS